MHSNIPGYITLCIWLRKNNFAVQHFSQEQGVWVVGWGPNQSNFILITFKKENENHSILVNIYKESKIVEDKSFELSVLGEEFAPISYWQEEFYPYLCEKIVDFGGAKSDIWFQESGGKVNVQHFKL